MSGRMVCTPILRVEEGVAFEKQDVAAVERTPRNLHRRAEHLDNHTDRATMKSLLPVFFCRKGLRDKSQVTEVLITDENRVNVSIASPPD